ncbi:hypothetical protein A8B75_03390 [Sphingomonadales bacterium EhC05]|nr:hypothetical protein A8B75_03390 [Sphingomonadales bacterium EhC05]
MIKILVQRDNFDIGVETTEIAKLGGGALASFIGQVRADNGLHTLELEHYPAMTEKSLHAIAEHAKAHWNLHAITIIHRVGPLPVGDNIVLVITGSDHRQAAIDACSYAMDQLKTVAPFWKKEQFDNGRSEWVQERQSDLQAAKNWDD